MNHTRVIGVVVIFLICVIAGWLLSAQSALAQEEENPIAEYANGMQIEYAEAEHRLRLQAEMSLVEQRIAEDDAYFASWTQHEPTFGLVVSFAAPDGEERIQKYLEGVEWADLVMVQESDITREELLRLREQIVAEAEKTEIIFGSGVNYMTGKVTLYAEAVEELREHLEGSAETAPMLDRVEFIEEPGAAPADYDYPYLLGGHGLATNLLLFACTSGFPVYRASDSVRFISTAGHCDNTISVKYGGVDAVYMGNVVWENDPVSNVGPFGDDLDFQVHDAAGARSFDLTNRIKTGNTTTQSVIGTETRISTLNDWVCKHGSVTGETCGFVDNIDFNPPHHAYGTSDNYVRVVRASWYPPINIVCEGDSGSPVYKYWGAGVYALGVLSGGVNIGCTGPTIGNAWYFFYSPIDYINWSPYRILTQHYPQWHHQHVFYAGGICTEYITPVDAQGVPNFGALTSRACHTSAPGSGTVQSYAAVVTGHQLIESIWEGSSSSAQGGLRSVPLHANGTVNWTAAPGWYSLGTTTPPRAQDMYVVGNFLYQHVFWSETNCEAFRAPLTNTGQPDWGAQISLGACQTSAPGSGTIQSYGVTVSGEYLREAIWRNGVSYTRDVPLNATNTAPLWSSAPAWSNWGAGTVPLDQGIYLLSYQ
ncbi:MAG: hypothetical protein KF893_13735 [Caldilineaceae bacterium]|nr:hypothetical protein [Caldilineaceae bacterium]